MSDVYKELTPLKTAAINYINENNVQEPIDIFEAGAKWREENPGWISVDEKLPDINYVVLGYADLSDKFEEGDHLIGVYPYTKDGFDTFGSNIKITYWMPLPYPPQK